MLAVDDDAKIREAVLDYLTHKGIWVLTAETGQQALEIFAADQPDLIVLDLMLPDIPGEEVCRRIRRASSVPIYDPSTNTLLLSNYEPEIFNQSCDRLIIAAAEGKTGLSVGDLEINADTVIGTKNCDTNVSITREWSGVTVGNGATLTINSKTFDVNSNIRGSGTGEKLILNGCGLTAKGTSDLSAIEGFDGGITINGSFISSPEDAEVKDGAVVDKDGEPVTGELQITGVRSYGVLINLNLLTNENIDKLETFFTKSSDAAEKRETGEHFASYDP